MKPDPAIETLAARFFHEDTKGSRLAMSAGLASCINARWKDLKPSNPTAAIVLREYRRCAARAIGIDVGRRLAR